MKVLHFPDFDYRTRVLTFAQALREVRQWSQSHPSHCPILILVEVKQDSAEGLPTKPHPFGAEEYDALDAEILSVFERQEVLAPDDVRGDSDCLRDAIARQGWPLLDRVRGKVLFALDNEGEQREAYLSGHPSLEGRLLFVSVPPQHPAAAFRKLNDPIQDFDEIRTAVQAGLLVRTRADAGTVESRECDSRRLQKALASGAQFISTDYPEPDARWSDYQARLPGGLTVRGNPVSGCAWATEELEPSAGVESVE